MKKILLTAICLSLLTTSVSAQITNIIRRATNPFGDYSEKRTERKENTRKQDQKKKNSNAEAAAEYHNRMHEADNRNKGYGRTDNDKKADTVKEETNGKTSDKQKTTPVEEKEPQKDLSNLLPTDAPGSSKPGALKPIRIYRNGGYIN